MSNIDSSKTKNKDNMEAQWSDIFYNTFLNTIINRSIENNIKIKELTEKIRKAEHSIITNNFPLLFLQSDFNRIRAENRLIINEFKIGLKYRINIDIWGHLSEFEKQSLLSILNLRSDRYLNILNF